MSTDATQEAPTAESFVRRAMTADREQLKALFAEALGRATALTQENPRLRERLQWFQDNGGSYPEQLENELDAVKAQNDRIRAAVEPLIAEVKNLRDTLSASSRERHMQVADGWHAFIKPVEAALEGKEGN